jgi:hypothetical protein
MRCRLLSWLAGELTPYGLTARVLQPSTGAAAVLRVDNARTNKVRFVACVPAPQLETWAWVWSAGWAMVADPRAVDQIARTLR